MKTCLVIVLLAAGTLNGSAVPAKIRPDAKPDAKKEPRPIKLVIPQINRGEEKVAARLRDLKFDVVLLPWDKLDPDKLKDVDVILLPTHWGAEANPVRYFEEIHDAFHRFVKRGGGLLVCQPNPAPMKTATPKLLPYPITFQNRYDDKDKNCVNLAPAHFITEDLAGDAVPFPFDPMLTVDKRYTILAKQKSTDWASLVVCSFGDGRVVVQTGSESRGAIIAFSDELLRRMVVWAAGRDKR